jgi:hypothetical protein
VSFQITCLKVLAGQPGGRASLEELRRAVAILISSGSDWTERTRRMAARAPDLDIFSQSFVTRHVDGWQITDTGREFLSIVERPSSAVMSVERAPETVKATAPEPVTATPVPVRLVTVNRRGRRRRATRGRSQPSAA